MSPQTRGVKIQALIERTFYPQSADGEHGFYERTFSITNQGREPIDLSGLTMKIRLAEVSQEYPLAFPEGVTRLMPQNPVVLSSSLVEKIPYDSSAIITLSREGTGYELARVAIQYRTK